MLFHREAFKREISRRIIEVSSKTLGFQQHARRHSLAPAVHRTSEYPKRNAEFPQVRTDRQPVWSGPNNRDIHRLRHLLLVLEETPIRSPAASVRDSGI